MNDNAHMYKDLSFGTYLKTCRQDRGMSLEQIEDITKIQKQMLLAIEREEIDVLPEDVFVKGFLRAYASSLGVNGADVVRRYMEYKEKTTPKAIEITGSVRNASYNRNIIIFFIGFVLLIFFIVFFVRPS